jgi:hypothetical protein
LYEQVPKECLPTEYGGNAGSVAEYWGESKHHDKHEKLHSKGTTNISDFE